MAQSLEGNTSLVGLFGVEAAAPERTPLSEPANNQLLHLIATPCMARSPRRNLWSITALGTPYEHGHRGAQIDDGDEVSLSHRGIAARTQYCCLTISVGC